MTVRFGVIGTNWITEAFITAAGHLEDFSLTAVYSRTSERAKEFAEKFAVRHIYTDITEMATSGTVDAVYIASPNFLHAKQAIQLMQHGIHVICEKPFASNTREVKVMIQTAKKHKVVLMEALKSTFLPTFQNIRGSLPKIGKVRRYFASYCQYSSRYDKYKEGIVLNAFNPAFSNGSLMDIGVYCVYPAVYLFGNPDSVKASGILLESGVDGQGSLLLQYKELEAVIMHAKITDSVVPSEIMGENGTIIIDKISTPQKAVIHYRNGNTEDISVNHAFPPMYYEAKEFIGLIKKGVHESSINTFENSLITATVLETARKQIGISFPADQE
ncbi:Gfo/Idh/MocA family oxidoreductase [Bacillaceae bacterium Marseille-Q3522]|nr:Gfo/Idh/MocA family oxidoreductase [Bacillaceae bacterium Marseille-Q3522]